jgi:hypothetical protein
LPLISSECQWAKHILLLEMNHTTKFYIKPLFIVTVIEHQFIPWIVSDWLTLAPCVVCYCLLQVPLLFESKLFD